MSDEHARGDVKGKFCYAGADNCGHNKYTDCVKKAVIAWEAQAAGSSLHREKYGPERYQLKKPQAHHSVCICAADYFVSLMYEQKLGSIVRQTEWCVNAPANMVALPVWPHTLQWYCTSKGNLRKSRVSAPPFKDLAQHCYDHMPYLEDVKKQMEPIVEMAMCAVAQHEDPTGIIVGLLNDEVETFASSLEGRSTHSAWKQGINHPRGKWYAAFSMARTNPTQRTFPRVEGELADKLQALKNLISKTRR